MSIPYYSRRLMGPIILITIGVLFMLDEFFPDHNWGFGHTWPILLIVIGAVKIFERFLAPVNPPLVPPPSGPAGSSPNTTWQTPPQPGSATPGGPTGGNPPPQP